MMPIPMLMLTAQAVSEAIRHGDPVTWPAVGLAAVAAVGSWLSIIYGTRMAKKNNGKNPKPGEGRICGEHGEAIIGLKQSDDEIKETLLRMDGKLDRLIERPMRKA